MRTGKLRPFEYYEPTTTAIRRRDRRSLLPCISSHVGREMVISRAVVFVRSSRGRRYIDFALQRRFSAIDGDLQSLVHAVTVIRGEQCELNSRQFRRSASAMHHHLIAEPCSYIIQSPRR